jgi:hypothetical protein
MTRTPVNTPHRDTSSAQAELDKEVRHIRDLVFIRTLLSTGGATDVDLREYDAAIDSARTQLAETAKRASARCATAA